MAITERDIELFAARIRPYFAPEHRAIAYELAYGLARLLGPRVKQLTPDTTYAELIGWIDGEKAFGGSLERVELVVAAEVELGSAFTLPDDLAAERVTFRDLVLRQAKRGHTKRQ